MDIKESSSKSLIAKRLLTNFKTNIQDLVTDLVELYPKYNMELSIVSIYISGLSNEDIVDFLLMYIENIFVKKIDIKKENLSLFIDTVISLIQKSAFSESKKFEEEIEIIKKDLEEN